jgi:hypothetical protein
MDFEFYSAQALSREFFQALLLVTHPDLFYSLQSVGTSS